MRRSHKPHFRDAWVVALFRAALRFYPRPYLERFGDEMVQVFRASCKNVRALRGSAGIAALLARSALDVLVTGLEERFMSSSSGALRLTLFLVLATALGGVSGWLDVHNTDVQVAVGCLLLFGFGLGCTLPRWWWLGAMLMGSCVPAANAIALLIGAATPYPVTSATVAQSFLALIPALIGAGVGGLVRLLLSGVGRTQPTKAH